MENYTRFWHLEGGAWIDVALRYDSLPIKLADKYLILANLPPGTCQTDYIPRFQCGIYYKCLKPEKISKYEHDVEQPKIPTEEPDRLPTITETVVVEEEPIVQMPEVPKPVIAAAPAR